MSNSKFNPGHALVVGIGDDLPGTIDDAQALADVLTDPTRCAYPANQVHLLTGENATHQAILDALDTLVQSPNLQSTTLIYFSGHGYRVTSSMGAAYFLLPYGYKLDDLTGTCINGADFTAKLRAIQSQKLLVLLDCCRAGGIGEPKEAGLTFAKSPLPPEAETILAEGKGRVIIASSRQDELSFSGKPYSAFTVALLESLSGKGVDVKDGYVRVSDLVLHARQVVPERTGGKQHPTIKFHQADNFAVAYYAAGAKEPNPLIFPHDPKTAAVPEPPPTQHIDLRNARVGGSVVTGNLSLDGGSTFVGGNQTTIQGDGNVFGEGGRATVIKTGDHSPVTFVKDRQGRDDAIQQARALHTYLERLMSECGTLHLRGMDPRAADATQKETMSLAAVYTALDTNLRVDLVSDKEKPTLKRQVHKPLPTDGIFQFSFDLERPMTVVEAVSQIDRLVLLGNPGAGKSTFVNYLAFQLAQASWHRQAVLGDEIQALPGWARGLLIPVRVILRDLARAPQLAENSTATALWSFIVQTLADAHLSAVVPMLEERLDGQVILLLDGLDEVDARARRWILDAVDQFALTHAHTPILVTCRVYAYQDADWQLSRFQQATLAPFDGKKMDHFIAAWYAEVARIGLLSVSESEIRAGRLCEAVCRPDLRVLAPNPLLLTMMALLHSSYGRLPEDRVQLYSEIVELLLARWEQSRLGRETLMQALIAPRDLRFALEEVAYRVHSQLMAGETEADVPEALLREIFKEYVDGSWDRAGNVLRYVQSRAGLLLERKPGVYTFPHRTLQEYLVGCHLSVQPDFPTRIADLVQDDETRWREPFLLAIAKTGRAENRVDQALAVVDNLCPRTCVEVVADEQGYRCAWLAGEALLEIGVDKLLRRDAWAVRLERVAGWLAQLLEAGALEPVERAAAGRVLAHLGDPRDFDALVFILGGPFTMGSGDEDTGARDDERPQHTVEVADFCIGKYPVTNAQYAKFIKAGGYDERRFWTEAGWAWRQGGHKGDKRVHTDRPEYWDDPSENLLNHPIIGVSWDEALAYTRWLAEVTGQPYRLPTEAEWERAARGTDGRVYPWGNEWKENCANTSKAGVNRTTAVGAFPLGASPYGALDMSGNVWEWCSSIHKGYPYQTCDGRENPEGNENDWRVTRGGSYLQGKEAVRCSSRDKGCDLAHGSRGDGFRVALSGSLPSDY